MSTKSLYQVWVGTIKRLVQKKKRSPGRNVSGNRNREMAEGIELNDKRNCQTTSTALINKTQKVHIDLLYCRNAVITSSVIREM